MRKRAARGVRAQAARRATPCPGLTGGAFVWHRRTASQGRVPRPRNCTKACPRASSAQASPRRPGVNRLAPIQHNHAFCKVAPFARKLARWGNRSACGFAPCGFAEGLVMSCAPGRRALRALLAHRLATASQCARGFATSTPGFTCPRPPRGPQPRARERLAHVCVPPPSAPARGGSLRRACARPCAAKEKTS